MPRYRVLSIDGGGIRGLITTVVLQRLVATPGLERLLAEADLLAGTSTGGLLALGIAHGLPLSVIRDTYARRGPKIFDDSFFDDVVDLGKLIGADYDIAPLRRELRKLFGEATLGDLKQRVLITAFDLDNEDPSPAKRTWKPKLFHNFSGPENDRSIPIVKCGLYTSAAPSFFPSVDGYIDGGVFASNPSMCALAQTQDVRYEPVALDDVVLLSLGTGTNLQYITGATHDWGYIQWAKPLLSLMLSGTAGIADYQCAQLLRERYHRLAPALPPGKSIGLDAAKDVDYMIEFAERVPLGDTIEWLRARWLPP
jgi:patatin-like phospholipase/acyl hydrolase